MGTIRYEELLKRANEISGRRLDPEPSFDDEPVTFHSGEVQVTVSTWNVNSLWKKVLPGPVVQRFVKLDAPRADKTLYYFAPDVAGFWVPAKEKNTSKNPGELLVSAIIPYYAEWIPEIKPEWVHWVVDSYYIFGPDGKDVTLSVEERLGYSPGALLTLVEDALLDSVLLGETHGQR